MPRDSARVARKPAPNGRRQLVAATYSMPTDIFVKHFNARHSDSLAGLTRLPGNIVYEVEISYRKFHERLHATRVDLDHRHSPDPDDAAIEWSLLCIQRNRGRGWHEIAGYEGVVCVFPDDQIATRIGGVTEHHRNIPEAVKRLANGG